MKTGLTRRQKTTAVYFDEDSPTIEVCTPQHFTSEAVAEICGKVPGQLPADG